MVVQISSGQGPEECELAVYKLYMALKKEFDDISIINANEIKWDYFHCKGNGGQNVNKAET